MIGKYDQSGLFAVDQSVLGQSPRGGRSLIDQGFVTGRCSRAYRDVFKCADTSMPASIALSSLTRCLAGSDASGCVGVTY